MFLKKLEISGFKSFAKKTELWFEPGITAIVGPNGSGKSNIADGLRWVFGEQSLKLLRGKKSEDVIFAGSDKRARLGMAEVLVYFDNTDGKIPVDYSEVVLGRRMARDGLSEYLLNGSPVRLLDIQDLLLRSGLVNSSYHVIGQGMIDQLILGGAAAVKELVEEAAGIKPYYVKRERALRRMLRTESNLEQVRLLTREIEPRLRSLRRQTRRLERREEVEQELRGLQTVYYGQQLRGMAGQLAEVEGKIAIFDRQLTELTAEIDKLAAEIESQEKTAAESEQLKKLRQEIDELNKEKQKLLEEQAELSGKLKAREFVPSLPKLSWTEMRSRLKSFYEKFTRLLAGFSLDEGQRLAQELKSLLADLEVSQTQEEERAEEKRLEEVKNLITEVETKLKTAEERFKQTEAKEDERKKQLFVRERLLRNKQDTLLATRDQKNLLSIEQAKLTTRKEALEHEAREALGPAFQELLETKPAAAAAPAGLSEQITRLKRQLEQIGGVDELTVQEHKETEERYQYLTSQLKDLEKGMADLKTVIAELDQVIKKEFNEAFGKIAERFSHYFRVLFGGGRVTMSLLKEAPAVSPEDINDKKESSFAEASEDLREESKSGRTEITGIQINATPPGKKLSGVAALSGGERALTSIALLSALLSAYPSPFVVLDEVDAALDEANSIRFGKILGQLAEATQFITITHNRETMRQSHTLYGVTMGEDGVSRLLSLKLEQAAVYSSKN